MVADAPTTDGLGKRYRTFSGWGMAAGKVEALLVVGGFDVNGGVEAILVNKDVNIKEGDKGRGDGPGKSDTVAAIEALKEKEKGDSKHFLIIFCFFPTSSLQYPACHH